MTLIPVTDRLRGLAAAAANNPCDDRAVALLIGEVVVAFDAATDERYDHDADPVALVARRVAADLAYGRRLRQRQAG